MNQFAHVLRRAEARLEAPEPHRSRILLEIAQDLEELYRAYRARGLSEEEAAERAEATFGASGEVLDELGQVHAPAYSRLLARFSARGRHKIERALLTGLTLFALVAGAFGATAGGVIGSPSPLLWPLLALLAAGAWKVAAAILDLYLRPYQPAPRGRLAPVVALAALSLVIGSLGALVEGWALAASIDAAGAWETAAALPYVRRGSQLLALALCISLALMLAWFHLRRRAVELERARTIALHLTHHSTEGALR